MLYNKFENGMILPIRKRGKIMKSIKTIYKIGYGPSSSHTIGPAFAAINFANEYSDADNIKVVLYGSLAKTGKGHGTDRAISDALSTASSEIIFDVEDTNIEHPNTVDFIAYKNNSELGRKRYYSVGGGEIRAENDKVLVPKEVYKEGTFCEIAKYC